MCGLLPPTRVSTVVMANAASYVCGAREGGREGGWHAFSTMGGADNQVSQKESHLVQSGSGIHPRRFLLLRILSSSTSGRPRILGITCTFDRGEYAGVTCFWVMETRSSNWIIHNGFVICFCALQQRANPIFSRANMHNRLKKERNVRWKGAYIKSGTHPPACTRQPPLWLP